LKIKKNTCQGQGKVEEQIKPKFDVKANLFKDLLFCLLNSKAMDEKSKPIEIYIVELDIIH